MRVVDENEYESSLRHRFEEVFRLVPPHGYLFTEKIRSRAILYPVDPILSAQQLHPLKDAILNCGENSFYLSILDRLADAGFDSHWEVPLEAISEYQEGQGAFSVLENALYSKRGRWGLRLDPEGYGIAGGSPDFLDVLFDNLLPSSEEQAIKFLAESDIVVNRDEELIPFLIDLIKHIYGPDVGEVLLRRAGVIRAR